MTYWLENRFEDLLLLWQSAQPADFLGLAAIIVLAGWVVRYLRGD